jgi:trimeric autotransporter adhesin
VFRRARGRKADGFSGTRICGSRLRSIASTNCHDLSENPGMEARISPGLITFTFVCIALVQNAQAVNPPPDGDYPGENTAEGTRALFNLASGEFNTGVGWLALYSNNNGWYNTAVGAGALFANRGTQYNTAVGAGALFNNIGDNNTANGAFALYTNNLGSGNIAIGSNTLYSNTTGSVNLAIGYGALFNNNAGGNTAIGFEALYFNTTADSNTAIGTYALYSNTTGGNNTANGSYSLGNHAVGDNNTAVGDQGLALNQTGTSNTAIGQRALYGLVTGDNNTALGVNAGSALTTGNNNIDIGTTGVSSEDNTIRIGEESVHGATFIAGISGQNASGGDAVFVTNTGKLGTVNVPSSARFKDEIKPMDKTSEVILDLKPVTFHYKKEIDPNGLWQFGLVAEEVEKVAPDLVRRDRDGKLHTVRYDAVNAMLLNEFLKEHRTVQELKANAAKQETIIAQQQKQIKALTAGLQKVNAQIRLDRPAPQVVAQE